ncbi:MAG: glycosyltransferase WbuB, partial [Verrucomicrobia bacterium]
MRVLLLNQTFYPDVVSTAQHLTDLAVRLAERGHKVTVVTSRCGYDNAALRFPSRETWRGINIHRVRSTRLGKSAKWRRAVDFASFTAACCLRLISLPRHDAIVALTSPPLIAFVGAGLVSAWRSKFFYWVMDLNPDEAIAAGWLRPDSFGAKVLNGMSRFSLRRADKVIALDRFMCDRLLAKGIPAEKIAVIPPWAHDDAVRYDPAGRERFREAHGLKDKFVVMYSGNHSPCHPLDSLMDAARRMAGQPQIAFCFVGGGSEFAKIQRFAEQHGLSNVRCLPYRPLDQLAASLSAADLHVVVMGDRFVGIVHPCKIYNILTVGVPVLYIGP